MLLQKLRFHSFLQLNIPLRIWRHTHTAPAPCIFFIHPSTDGHLSQIYALAIINNVAMNMENADIFPRQNFVSTKYPEIELLHYMVVLFLIFWGTFHNVFHSGHTNFVVVQLLSRVWLLLWIAARQISRFFTISWACSNSCPSSQWCHPTSCPLSAPSPPAFNPSQHQGLSQ